MSVYRTAFVVKREGPARPRFATVRAIFAYGNRRRMRIATWLPKLSHAFGAALGSSLARGHGDASATAWVFVRVFPTMLAIWLLLVVAFSLYFGVRRYRACRRAIFRQRVWLCECPICGERDRCDAGLHS